MKQFGTNPNTLRKSQLQQYVRQLQQTVQYWQRQTAHAKGMTIEQLRESFSKYVVVPEWKQEYYE